MGHSGVFQRRVHPPVALWGNGGGAEGLSPSRLSDAVPPLFTPVPIVKGSGLRCGPHLLCPRLTSPRQFSSGCPPPSSGLPRNTVEISRGKTRILSRIGAGFTKCIHPGIAPDFADGGLGGHVPTRPGCITPHIRFLFMPCRPRRANRPDPSPGTNSPPDCLRPGSAPRFRLGLPPHPASRRCTCPSANLRLCCYLVPGLAPGGIRAMHGTHVRHERRQKGEAFLTSARNTKGLPAFKPRCRCTKIGDVSHSI